MLGYDAPAEDVETIRDWFAPWHRHVDAVTLAAARALVGRDVPATAWKSLPIRNLLNPGTPRSSHGNRPETG